MLFADQSFLFCIINYSLNKVESWKLETDIRISFPTNTVKINTCMFVKLYQVRRISIEQKSLVVSARRIRLHTEVTQFSNSLMYRLLHQIARIPSSKVRWFYCGATFVFVFVTELSRNSDLVWKWKWNAFRNWGYIPC